MKKEENINIIPLDLLTTKIPRNLLEKKLIKLIKISANTHVRFRTFDYYCLGPLAIEIISVFMKKKEEKQFVLVYVSFHRLEDVFITLFKIKLHI